MTTDFRALCAELLDEFVYHTDWSYAEELKDRARAALGEAAEPAVPQDREPATWTEGVCGDGAALLKDGVMVPIEAVVRELNEGARARAALANEPAVPQGREPAAVTGQPSDEEWDALVESVWDKYQTVGYQGERFMYDGDFGSALDLVRKELSRWGHQPAPVPVSERLPEPEDCDAEGRCWWLALHQSWPCLYLLKADIALAAAVATHWLPTHALPLPGGTND